MSEYFPKGPKEQVDFKEFTAFGIQVSLKWGNARIIAQILLFAEAVAEQELHTIVESITDYNDGGGRTITLNPAIKPYDDIGKVIICLARKHLDWYTLWDVPGYDYEPIEKIEAMEAELQIPGRCQIH